MAVDDTDTWFEEQFRDRYQEHAAKVGRFNLAIFGKTGVGKSSLINAVFGSDVAATGIGQPVTIDSALYMSSAGFLGIYDTRGVEIGDDTETIIRDLDELITKNRERPLSDQIHAAWYCVRATDRRFESTEAEFIRRLNDLGLPVIVVMTQVPSRNGEYHADAVALARTIAELDLPIDRGRPVLVMAQDDAFMGQVQHGLDELLAATFRVVPEAVADALTAAQQIDLERKRKKATAVVAAAMAAAAGTGAIPIPLAASAVLVPLQVGMIASISAVYGARADVAATAAAVMPAIATGAGKTAVVGLLKLIPGAGTVIGGVINAAIAGALTGAMGYAWAAVCEQLIKDGDGVIDGDALRTLFDSEFVAQFTELVAAAAGTKGAAG